MMQKKKKKLSWSIYLNILGKIEFMAKNLIFKNKLKIKTRINVKT